jgi:cell division protease FtsH
VHKVTVIPRGRALGLTSYLPGRDVYNLEFRREMKGRLVSIMGGRAAEEIMYDGEFTAGASGDIQQATRLTLAMVCDMGMSSALGPRAYGEGSSQIFLGRSMSRDRNFSEETARLIDEEVRKMIDEAHQTALKILRQNREMLQTVADALMERETITGAELDMLVAGKELPPLPKITVDLDGDKPGEGKKSDEKPEKGTFPAKPSIFDRPSEMPS